MFDSTEKGDLGLEDILALKATSLPMLIKLKAIVKPHVNVTAFAGTCNCGFTLSNQELNGSPLSLASAHVCRLAERLKLSVPAKMSTVGMTLRTTTPAGDTAWLKTQMCGYPVTSSSAASRSVSM